MFRPKRATCGGQIFHELYCNFGKSKNKDAICCVRHLLWEHIHTHEFQSRKLLLT
jgi:hypothetical protein